MSLENAKAFLAKAKEDKELQAKMKALPKGDFNVALEKGLEIAKAAGFDFTADEWKQAYKDTSGGELSEKDLKKVSGGDTWWPSVPSY